MKANGDMANCGVKVPQQLEWKHLYVRTESSLSVQA